MPHRPLIIWSIAGHDSAGGAGLSADQRAADALGVHLCPVVAAVTAQSSRGVAAVMPLGAAQIEAQLDALHADMPPAAVKCGLLGSVAAVQAVARCIDHLRLAHPAQSIALVIDPVLRASAGGAGFADAEVLAALRAELLPRATLITPNRAEAARLLGLESADADVMDAVPDLATALQAQGPRAVVVTGGDGPEHWALDWLQAPQASGWLAGPRVPTPHHHGTGCTFASGAAAALAQGHTEADAVVLAKMLTHHALMHSRAAGSGRGPVIAQRGFAAGAAAGGAPLPLLGTGRELPWAVADQARFAAFDVPADGLYAIVDSAARVRDAAAAGLRCIQLRRKRAPGISDAAWSAEIDAHLHDSAQACEQAQATLIVNDHRGAAMQALTPQRYPRLRWGLHLGQEDWLALTAADRQALQANRSLTLGLSSHSPWELARAAGTGASYIACGPVRPTTTKDMPWLPQGPDNLAWWAAHSPAPVVAIGGLLAPQDLSEAARCGPAAVCVVRGLGQDLAEMQARVPRLREAVAAGRASPAIACPPWPHAVLPPG